MVVQTELDIAGKLAQFGRVRALLSVLYLADIPGRIFQFVWRWNERRVGADRQVIAR